MDDHSEGAHVCVREKAGKINAMCAMHQLNFWICTVVNQEGKKELLKINKPTFLNMSGFKAVTYHTNNDLAMCLCMFSSLWFTYDETLALRCTLSTGRETLSSPFVPLCLCICNYCCENDIMVSHLALQRILPTKLLDLAPPPPTTPLLFFFIFSPLPS